MYHHARPRAAIRFAWRRPSSRRLCAGALFLAAAVGAILAPVPDVAAQSLPPRLVVFEGFYNPG